jgi:hypothetical protein
MDFYIKMVLIIFILLNLINLVQIIRNNFWSSDEDNDFHMGDRKFKDLGENAVCSSLLLFSIFLS